MGYCEICGKYGDTTEVTIGDKSRGELSKKNMCPECAVKGAVLVKSMGGEVIFVDGSAKKKSSSSGCLSVLLLSVAAVGVLSYIMGG